MNEEIRLIEDKYLRKAYPEVSKLMSFVGAEISNESLREKLRQFERMLGGDNTLKIDEISKCREFFDEQAWEGVLFYVKQSSVDGAQRVVDYEKGERVLNAIRNIIDSLNIDYDGEIKKNKDKRFFDSITYSLNAHFVNSGYFDSVSKISLDEIPADKISEICKDAKLENDFSFTSHELDIFILHQVDFITSSGISKNELNDLFINSFNQIEEGFGASAKGVNDTKSEVVNFLTLELQKGASTQTIVVCLPKP